MGFGSSLQTGSSTENASTTDREQVYMKLTGENILRVLDEEEFTYWRYYMPVNVGGQQQKRSIVVGRGGPISDFFSKMDKEDPKRLRVSKRMLLNVLDRTPVKKLDGNVVVYPTQGLEVFPKAGPNGESLDGISVEPHNKVLILDLGPDLMTKLTMYHRRSRNARTFEPMNIWDFDVRVISFLPPGKEAKEVQRSVMPDADQDPLPKELADTLLKFDLTQVVRPMPEAAQKRLLAGEDLIEILKELNWPRPQATIKL